MFTSMPHIMAKFTKYIVRTFLVENPDTGQKYSFCNSGFDEYRLYNRSFRFALLERES